jgi:hypothetical protein
MSYVVESWASDRPADPFGGGEVRVNAVRLNKISELDETVKKLVDESTPQQRIVRVTLERTSQPKKMWDVFKQLGRDTQLDAEMRTAKRPNSLKMKKRIAAKWN